MIVTSNIFSDDIFIAMEQAGYEQDRLPGDILQLPYSTSDMKIRVNDYVISETVNYSLEKLHQNWLYMISKSVIPSNNIPNADFSNYVIADFKPVDSIFPKPQFVNKNTDTRGWFDTPENFVRNSGNWRRNQGIFTGVKQFTKIANVADPNNFNIIATTNTNVIMMSGSDTNNIDVLGNYFNKLNPIVSNNDITHPSNEILFQDIANHVITNSNELYVLDKFHKSIFKFDISGALALDTAILRNDTPGRLMIGQTGGSGALTDKTRFNTPLMIETHDDAIYVLDHVQGTGTRIKKYDSDLNWKQTYDVSGFLDTGPLDFKYNPDTENFYVLCHRRTFDRTIGATTTTEDAYRPADLVVFDSDFNHVKTDALNDDTYNASINTEDYKKLYFSNQNKNVMYIVTNQNVYKKYVTRPTRFIGRFLFDEKLIGAGDRFKNLQDMHLFPAQIPDPETPGDVLDKDEILLLDTRWEVVYRFLEDSNYERSLQTQFDNRVMKFDNMQVDSDEYVSTLTYNKVFTKHMYNNLLLLENTYRKFTTKYDSSGISQYIGFRYLNIEEIQQTNYTVNLDHYIGNNELLLTETFNRCLKQIYNVQENVLDKMQERSVNVFPLLETPIQLNSPYVVQLVVTGADTDGDGIFDQLDPDDDNDGLLDIQEIAGIVAPLSWASRKYADSTGRVFTDPLLADTDFDGISDRDEILQGTDPTHPSTDLDNDPDLTDAFPFTGSASQDTDQDGLPDGTVTTTPFAGEDVDGDGVLDYPVEDVLPPDAVNVTRDTDDDDDGYPNEIDDYPLNPRQVHDPVVDLDGDGYADELDIDDDGDGYLDAPQPELDFADMFAGNGDFTFNMWFRLIEGNNGGSRRWHIIFRHVNQSNTRNQLALFYRGDWNVRSTWKAGEGWSSSDHDRRWFSWWVNEGDSSGSVYTQIHAYYAPFDIDDNVWYNLEFTRRNNSEIKLYINNQECMYQEEYPTSGTKHTAGASPANPIPDFASVEGANMNSQISISYLENSGTPTPGTWQSMRMVGNDKVLEQTYIPDAIRQAQLDDIDPDGNQQVITDTSLIESTSAYSRDPNRVDGIDSDGDLIDDVIDTDDDNDLLPDSIEAQEGTIPRPGKYKLKTTYDSNGEVVSRRYVHESESEYYSLQGEEIDADLERSKDSDADTLSDETEYNQNTGTGTDPLDPDSDDDSVPDATDVWPLDKAASTDTDSDGLPDEVDKSLLTGNPYTSLTEDLDDDDDGMLDTLEASLTHELEDGTFASTDPKDADSDNDGVSDYTEIFIDGTNPLVPGLPAAEGVDFNNIGNIDINENTSNVLVRTFAMLRDLFADTTNLRTENPFTVEDSRFSIVGESITLTTAIDYEATLINPFTLTIFANDINDNTTKLKLNVTILDADEDTDLDDILDSSDLTRNVPQLQFISPSGLETDISLEFEAQGEQVEKNVLVVQNYFENPTYIHSMVLTNTTHYELTGDANNRVLKLKAVDYDTLPADNKNVSTTLSVRGNDQQSTRDKTINVTIPIIEDPDIDLDGLTASQEQELGTDPNDPDSDDDYISDGDEVALGSDPLKKDTDDDDIDDHADADIHTEAGDHDSDGVIDEFDLTYIKTHGMWSTDDTTTWEQIDTTWNSLSGADHGDVWSNYDVNWESIDVMWSNHNKDRTIPEKY